VHTLYVLFVFQVVREPGSSPYPLYKYGYFSDPDSDGKYKCINVYNNWAFWYIQIHVLFEVLLKVLALQEPNILIHDML
jgi:hypothetical protein